MSSKLVRTCDACGKELNRDYIELNFHAAAKVVSDDGNDTIGAETPIPAYRNFHCCIKDECRNNVEGQLVARITTDIDMIVTKAAEVSSGSR